MKTEEQAVEGVPVDEPFGVGVMRRRGHPWCVRVDLGLGSDVHFTPTGARALAKALGQMADEAEASNGSPDRAVVQADSRARGGREPGTIAWAEHVEAWKAYDKKWRCNQSAKRIHERGGFSFSELVEFLGREPTTWRPR